MSELPQASLGESLRVLRTAVVPSVARGLFSPRRRAMKLLTARDADGRAVAVLSGLRSRHGGEGVRILGGRMVVLWGERAIREVLERSADAYASDAGAKAKGMSHFQPDALTLSRGEEWRDRRAFNEHVLGGPGDRFREVATEEVDRLEVDGELDWPAVERLFDRITLRVIFGDSSRDDSELTARLERLMGEANRIAGLKPSGELYELQGALERKLRNPEPGSLLERFADAPQSDITRVVHQIPHWMFAMRDTLAANVMRALAVLAARRERSPNLEGYLEEAMRLWPTTPLLARETIRTVELGGERLDAGTQVMIVNTFNHRDRDRIPDADRFRPDRWPDAADDYRFNHLSHGTQDCPGAPLVRLLGTAVLARALERWELRLAEPDGLDGDEMPHMLDFFSVRIGVSARQPNGGKRAAEVHHAAAAPSLEH
jgi:cytochrome P450